MAYHLWPLCSKIFFDLAHIIGLYRPKSTPLSRHLSSRLYLNNTVSVSVQYGQSIAYAVFNISSLSLAQNFVTGSCPKSAESSQEASHPTSAIWTSILSCHSFPAFISFRFPSKALYVLTWPFLLLTSCQNQKPFINISWYPQSSSTLWNCSKCGVYTVESEAGC
jgi:hypothetical protein